MNPELPFIKGLDLNRGYYRDIVKPILEQHFPGLPYTAALIGYGSDVLGMDTAISMDHNWGPRMLIFVDDKGLIPEIDKCLGEHLPFQYKFYPTNFTDPRYDATQSMVSTDKKPVRHLIEICTLEDYLREKYALEKNVNLSHVEWLALADQQLLELTSGEVFHDGLDRLNSIREELAFYPEDICKLRLAVLWDYISNKEAFVGRCLALEDHAGIKINAGRLVNYLMKIFFYLERKYIPYSKWFGSAFRKLEISASAYPLVMDALNENNPAKIEERLNALYTLAVERHNAAAWLPPIDNKIRDYFNRPYSVIFAETIVKKIMESIKDPEIKSLDLGKQALDIILDR